MAVYSPKIEIINHFDNLINRVDIDIDECLEKYKEDQLLGSLNCSKLGNRTLRNREFISDCFRTDVKYSMSQTEIDFWSESTKVSDYLKQVRTRTIEELRKAQEDSLDYIKLNRSHFRAIDNKDELRRQLFSEKLYFQLHYKTPDDVTWVFKLYTLVTDFYMSQTDIELLEKFMNESEKDIESYFQDSYQVFDEKTILIGLLFGYFCQHLTSQPFPAHIIRVRKQEILNFKRLYIEKRIARRVILTCSSIDFSNLEYLSLYGSYEEVNLERLSSLKTFKYYIKEDQQISLGNLNSLLELEIVANKIDSDLQTKIIEHCPNIEKLVLNSGDFYKFNLDKLIYLRELSLWGEVIKEEFNLDLFNKSLSTSLEKLSIDVGFANKGNLAELFEDCHFPNLVDLFIRCHQIEKRMFNGLSNLQTLCINGIEKYIRILDNSDLFSNLKHLVDLTLESCFIESLSQTLFAPLTKLESLVLFYNQIESIGENTFLHLNNLHSLRFNYNYLTELNAKSFIGLDKLKLFEFNLNFMNDSYISVIDKFGYMTNAKRTID